MQYAKRIKSVFRSGIALLLAAVLLSGIAFSVFAHEKTETKASHYTVEFTYGEKEYVISGGSAVMLSDLLEQLGIPGEIQSWTVSDPELFDIFLGDNYGVLYMSSGLEPVPTNEGSIPWLLSLQPFDTTEWLKVAVDGTEYTVTVTDDNTTNNIPAPYQTGGKVETALDGYTSMTGDTNYNAATKPTNIKQSTSTASATDFAAGLSLSTIFIDQSKVGGDGRAAGQPNPNGIFTLLTTDTNIAGGFTIDGASALDTEGNPKTVLGAEVNYDPTRSTSLKQCKGGEITELNGPLYQIVYPDAAILPNGHRADLKITYSNAKIAVDQRLKIINDQYRGAIHLTNGSSISYYGDDLRNLKSTSDFTADQVNKMYNDMNNYINTNYSISTGAASFPNNPVVGHTMDATYQIVDKDGNPINGTFIFAMAGINLERDPYRLSGNNYGKPLWYYNDLNFNPVLDENEDPVDADEDGNPDYEIYGKNFNFFNESVIIQSGMVSDYVYVRPNTNLQENNTSSNAVQLNDQAHFYPQIITENGKVKFVANAQESAATIKGSGNDTTYSSGFVIMGDAFNGITITTGGHGVGGSGMNSQVFVAKQIWYRYVSSSGPNGNIQTTSEGNFGGTLDDLEDDETKSRILDPGAYVVPEGKTVTYTLTPADQYILSSLKVRNSSGALREITYNGDPLYTMTEGQTYKFRDAANQLCTLTALAGGAFKLDVPYALKNEEFQVMWERNIAKVTVKKQTVDNANGTFNFKIRASKLEEVTEYHTGTTWEDAIGSVWMSGTRDKEVPVINPSTGEPETDPISGDPVMTTVTVPHYHTDCKAPGGSDMTQDAIDNLAALIAGTTLVERVEITGGEYLWKTDKKLSDLGIQFATPDDDLFIGFLNAPSAVVGDTLATALNVGLSEGPERIYFFHPHTDVNTKPAYWNFDTNKSQSAKPNPEWYTFSLANGGTKEFDIPQKFEYEVVEEAQTGWELISIDGVSGAGRASGLLSEATNTTPEHVFLNREQPDLTVKKEMIDEETWDTFNFTVKITAPAVSAQEYTVTATATILDGVPTYEFSNSGSAFAVDGVIVPAGDFGYGESKDLDEICDRLLGLSVSSDKQSIAIGTQNGTVKTDALQSLSDWVVAQTSDDTTTVDYVFESPAVPEHPFVLSALPANVTYDTTNNQYTFILQRHGDTLTFPNLPFGYTYEVAEVDLPEEWTHVRTDGDAASDDLDSDKEVVFVNEKLGVFMPETGIYTDSIPYMLALGFVFVCLAGVAFRIRRKVRIDD